jgi:divalent metal cation (Fe/Co/Zn/Cd) transporter
VKHAEIKVSGILVMLEHPEIVNINIRKEMDGYFVATSAELPGLVLASADVHAIAEDIPKAIKALYKANFDIDVEVMEAFPASAREVKLPPAWMVVRNRNDPPAV